MALNWQHIKGVYGSGDSSSLVYTYLEFLADPYNTPKIYTSTENTSNPAKNYMKDWGNVLTTSGMTQTITKQLEFGPQDPTHPNEQPIGSCKICDASQLIFGTNTTATYIRYIPDTSLEISSETSMLLKAINGITIDGVKTTFSKDVSFKGDLTLEPGKTLTCGDSTRVDKDYIQAPYFNATSDKRAKTNIQPFNNNALDIINKLQTYTYNYINSNTKSYGLMAQDLLDVDLNGFSFVDNKTATGENHDYMTIHESKLVYLLIEAIKEQQTQINELKQKLEELTNGK